MAVYNMPATDTLEEIVKIHKEQKGTKVSHVVKEVYNKKLLSNILFGFQPIGKGRGRASAAECLYDWLNDAKYNKLPGANKYKSGELHIGTLMSDEGETVTFLCDNA